MGKPPHHPRKGREDGSHEGGTERRRRYPQPSEVVGHLHRLTNKLLARSTAKLVEFGFHRCKPFSATGEHGDHVPPGSPHELHRHGGALSGVRRPLHRVGDVP